MHTAQNTPNPTTETPPGSIAAFIKALGGRDVICRIIDRSPNAVSNWLSGGIPTKHFRALVMHGRSDPALAWVTYDYLEELNKKRLSGTSNSNDEGRSIAA